MGRKKITSLAIVLLSLPVACAGGSSDPDPGPPSFDELSKDERRSTIVDLAFDDYTRAHAGAQCEEGDTPVIELQKDERLVTRASPQCAAERFGLDPSGELWETETVNQQELVDEQTFALCSCSNIEASNKINSPDESEIAGDVGTNESILASAPIRLDGGLISGGTARLDNAFASGFLRIDGTLTASNDVSIAGDATVSGFDIPGERVSVNGTLTVPDGADLSSVISTGETLFSEKDVPPPCDCSDDVDYAALREEFLQIYEKDYPSDEEYDRFAYYDESDYLYPAPEYLLSDLDQDREVYLGCGSYYFGSIESSAALSIHAVGEVRVYVDGDVRVAGALEIAPLENSTLTLFVAGEFNPTNDVIVGSAEDPDATRMYVQENTRLAGPFALHGTLLSPNAPFVANNTFETQGAVFAKSFDLAGPIHVTEGPRFTGDACQVSAQDDGNEAD